MKHPIKALIAACMLAFLVGVISPVAFAATVDSGIASAESAAAGSKRAHDGKNGFHVDVFSVAASVLGKTSDEVKASVKDGGRIGALLIASGKVDAFKASYLAELKTKLDAALAAGAMTKIEADAKYTEMKSAIDAYDGTTSLKGEKSSGKLTGKADSAKKNGIYVDVLSVASSVLGKTKDEVKEAAKGGKIGDLLIASGKVDAFKAAYLTELKTKLDAAVTAGILTKTEADAKYAEGKAVMDAYDGTTNLCGETDSNKGHRGKSDTFNKAATTPAAL